MHPDVEEVSLGTGAAVRHAAAPERRRWSVRRLNLDVRVYDLDREVGVPIQRTVRVTEAPGTGSTDVGKRHARQLVHAIPFQCAGRRHAETAPRHVAYPRTTRSGRPIPRLRSIWPHPAPLFRPCCRPAWFPVTWMQHCGD